MNRLLRRHPDKPYRRPATALPELETQCKYLASTKMDGHRCVVVADENIEFWSRHDKRLPVDQKLYRAVRFMELPKGTVLDTEWMARRPNYDLEERLYLIGILWWEGEWQGRKPESVRWQQIVDLMSRIKQTLEGAKEFPIKLPSWTDSEYLRLFEESKKSKIAEGIVLKKKDSKLVGDPIECKKNPAWIKIKWRSDTDHDLIQTDESA